MGAVQQRRCSDQVPASVNGRRRETDSAVLLVMLSPLNLIEFALMSGWNNRAVAIWIRMSKMFLERYRSAESE